MGAFARMQRHLFRVNGVRMRLTSTLAVTYAANAVSLSLPIAGPAASVGYAYTQFRRLGADSAATSWTLGISWVVSTFTLGVVLAVGALTSGNTTTAVIGLASAVVAVVPLVGLLVALRNVGRVPQSRAPRHDAWAMVGRIGRRPDDEWAAALPVDAFLDDLATVRMSASSYVHVGGALPPGTGRPTPSAWSSPSSPPAGTSPGTDSCSPTRSGREPPCCPSPPAGSVWWSSPWPPRSSSPACTDPTPWPPCSSSGSSASGWSSPSGGSIVAVTLPFEPDHPDRPALSDPE